MEGIRQRGLVLASVLLLHVAIAYWLIGFRIAPHSTQDSGATPLLVTFIRRPGNSMQEGVRRDPLPVTMPRRPPKLMMTNASSEGSAAHITRPVEPLPKRASPKAPLPATLDLHVREDERFQRISAVPPGLHREPERYTALVRTRFARAWVPQGNALRSAGWRNPVLGLALGAFGGPPVHCSEVERRLRKPNCLNEDADTQSESVQ